MEIENKAKIAIVIDKKGWAYANIANQIKRNLDRYYKIEIIPMEIFKDNVVKLFLYLSDYDLSFFLWRGLISWVYSDYSKAYIEKLGFEYDTFIEKFLKNKNIVSGVYDHWFLNAEKERTEFILNNIKDYYVSSQILKQIYFKFDKKPSFVISDGVDLDLFKMFDNNKYKNLNFNQHKLKIGWTGNSKFSDEKDDDLKGLNKVIRPTVVELIQEGYNVELKIADGNIELIPHDKMPNYYNDIDIYVCASRTEGTPNPVLEAMACGVPIISTNVGIVPEVFGTKQKEFVINRGKEDLKQKIKKLYSNTILLEQLSSENLCQIQEWSWEKKSKIFKEFFDKNLQR